jgi:hypothetical protein
MVCRAARVLIIGACGACGFTHGPGGATVDADGDAPQLDVPDADPDAPDAAPDADLGAWNPPIAVVELNDGPNDDDPALTSDMLEIFFASTRGGGTGGEDIWTAQRDTVGDPWRTPVEAAALNSASTESNVKISGDGLLITFASTRSPSQAADLWAATRPDRLSPWNPPVQVVELSSAAGEWHAHPSPDRLQIVLCSSRDGDEDLYTSSRPTVDSAWVVPVAIGGDVAAAENDCDPMMPTPSSELYFASQRPGLGAYDLYVAVPAGGGTFATPSPIAELNTASNDRDPWVSPDRRTMYFTSTRDAGSDEIFVSTR